MKTDDKKKQYEELLKEKIKLEQELRRIETERKIFQQTKKAK